MTALPRLHLVTDDAVLANPEFDVRARNAIEAGGARVALHLRGHGTSTARLYEHAAALQPVCARLGARLLVNDRVDVALACDADGVQLGLGSLPVADARTLVGGQRLIGYSAHAAEEAAGALAAGADFVLLGSVWPTTSHPDRTPAGLDAVRATAAAAAGAPVIAIGGVTPERVADAAGADAHGVAVLSGVWRAADVVAAVTMYLDALAAVDDERGKEQQ